MSAADLKAASHAKWGYIMDPGQPFTAPVLLGEFGSSDQWAWMANLGAYLRELDMDWTYWPLNGGPESERRIGAVRAAGGRLEDRPPGRAAHHVAVAAAADPRPGHRGARRRLPAQLN